MIKLIKFSDREYAVLTNDPRTTGKGTLKQAAKTMQKLGVSLNEFERAVQDMHKKGTNVSDFGLFRKSFQFSEFIDLDSERGVA